MRQVLMLLAVVASATCVAQEARTVLSQTTIDGPSGSLFVDDGGSGPETPVVLIHSLAGRSAQWAPQLTHLRRTRRAVALDLRGHGRSESPSDGRLGPDAYATDVRHVMDRLGIRRAVLVGHSLGGGVAVAVTGLSPGRVAGLLLVDPIDDPSKRPADPRAAAFLQRLDGPEYEAAITSYWTQILEFASEEVRQRVLADLRATPRETVVGSMKAMAGFDAQAALEDYKGPMLSITTPLNEFPTSLHNVVTAIKQERMTNVSHWLHLDRPEEFNAMLDRFLTSAVDQQPLN